MPLTYFSWYVLFSDSQVLTNDSIETMINHEYWHRTTLLCTVCLVLILYVSDIWYDIYISFYISGIYHSKIFQWNCYMFYNYIDVYVYVYLIYDIEIFRWAPTSLILYSAMYIHYIWYIIFKYFIGLLQPLSSSWRQSSLSLQCNYLANAMVGLMSHGILACCTWKLPCLRHQVTDVVLQTWDISLSF